MPSFNLEAFKANFKGGARGYLFYYLPQWPGGIAQITPEAATYLVRTTTLPENTLEEGIVNWQGYDFKYAVKHTFTDWTITFNVDKDAKIRFLFEAWMNKIHNPETNVYAPLEDYMMDQAVQLLDYNGNALMHYTLHNAWPKMVGAVTLDYASTEIAQFDVTFTYSHHTVGTSPTM